MGLDKLHQKLSEPDFKEFFQGLFPKDHPKNTRFAINFFTSIGLGPLTEDLRNYLKSMPELIMNAQHNISSSSSSDDDSSNSDSSNSDSNSSSDSDSDSNSDSSSDSE